MFLANMKRIITSAFILCTAASIAVFPITASAQSINDEFCGLKLGSVQSQARLIEAGGQYGTYFETQENRNFSAVCFEHFPYSSENWSMCSFNYTTQNIFFEVEFWKFFESKEEADALFDRLRDKMEAKYGQPRSSIDDTGLEKLTFGHTDWVRVMLCRFPQNEEWNDYSILLDYYVKEIDDEVKGWDTTVDSNTAVESKYVKMAYDNYNSGHYTLASQYFEMAYLDHDSTSGNVDAYLYNAALSALLGENAIRAESLLNQCIEKGYEADGQVYFNLAEAAKLSGDTEAEMQRLQEGAEKYPENQSILIAMINICLDDETRSDELMGLLDKAKANDPHNASLWYVEGNALMKAGKEDEAIKAFSQCVKVDPAYPHGFMGIGQHWYNRAYDIYSEMDKTNNPKKLKELNDKYIDVLQRCIDPFESAFRIADKESLKKNIASYLANVYKVLMATEPGYTAKYEKYSKY